MTMAKISLGRATNGRAASTKVTERCSKERSSSPRWKGGVGGGEGNVNGRETW